MRNREMRVLTSEGVKQYDVESNRERSVIY